jgi:hypothetical protein
MRNLKLYLFILIIASIDAYGQITSARNISGDRFFFDAVVFRDAEQNLGRVDVYAVFPY